VVVRPQDPVAIHRCREQNTRRSNTSYTITSVLTKTREVRTSGETLCRSQPSLGRTSE